MICTFKYNTQPKCILRNLGKREQEHDDIDFNVLLYGVDINKTYHKRLGFRISSL